MGIYYFKIPNLTTIQPRTYTIPRLARPPITLPAFSITSNSVDCLSIRIWIPLRTAPYLCISDICTPRGSLQTGIYSRSGCIADRVPVVLLLISCIYFTSSHSRINSLISFDVSSRPKSTDAAWIGVNFNTVAIFCISSREYVSGR